MNTPTPVPAPAPPVDGLAPVYTQYPFEVEHAEGVWLINARGDRVLDLYGGHAVAALGYGHPGWTEALTAQARACQFQTNAIGMNIRARAAQRLLAFSGLDLASVFLVNSGAEANENALRLALHMTSRPHVAALEGAFHGRTAAAAAVTWGAEAWYGFPHKPFDVSFMPRHDIGAIAAHVTERTAAVIVEPVQGLAGAVDIGAAYLGALRARCDQVGALLIFDEVQCGFGRVGAPFAATLYGVTPDLLTTAKALGNGFPCAALLCSAPVSAALTIGQLGTTYGGGPMACAALLAAIEAIESERLLDNVRQMSATIRRTCCVGPVTAIQGEGLLLGLRVRRPAKQIQAELLRRGILAGTASDPEIVRLLPPFILAAQHVELLRRALVDIGG
jgi:acetylornithine/succinyldiaminopimelate/putrescine aminotransferase